LTEQHQCRWPGKSTERIRLPSASTITAIFVVTRAICRWPDFESGAMLMDPDQGRIDEDVFEIRILVQVLENPLPHAFCAHRQKRV
jgi:hypothetical protein